MSGARGTRCVCLTRLRGGIFRGLAVSGIVDFALIRACMPLLASRTCLRNTGPSLSRCPSRLRVLSPPELYACVAWSCLHPLACASTYSLAPATTLSQTRTTPPYSCSPALRTRTCTCVCTSARARACAGGACMPPCTVLDPMFVCVRAHTGLHAHAHRHFKTSHTSAHAHRHDLKIFATRHSSAIERHETAPVATFSLSLSPLSLSLSLSVSLPSLSLVLTIHTFSLSLSLSSLSSAQRQ